MAGSYHRLGWDHPVTFDLFVRSFPPNRRFLVAAGLEAALQYLENLHFSEEHIQYLASLDLFSRSFLDYLRGFRFRGDVWAIPEGEIFFPGEPLLRVTAPIIEAQIVETALLNFLCFESTIATKAARVVLAAEGRPVVDFSPRRDHGPDAAVRVARATYIAGAVGTSNVLAGKIYGIPVYGTMAHSFVMAFENEVEAFRTFAEDYPKNAIFLIDTYDTLEGARNAVRVARELRKKGIQVRGVRLDSGNLAELSVQVRRILDQAGLQELRIFASGDLNEYRIHDLVTRRCPVDAFGVGTQMGTSADAPYLGGVYKLVEFRGEPRIKLSTGKVTIPGRKQVYRFFEGGVFSHDLLALEDERIVGGEPLLECYMRKGRRLRPAEPLTRLRERCAEALRRLPPSFHVLEGTPAAPPVRLSAGLQALLSRYSAAGPPS